MNSYAIFDLTVASDIPFEELIEDRRDAVLTVSRGWNFPDARYRFVHDWESEAGQVDLSLGVAGDSYALRFPGLAAFAVEGDHITCYPLTEDLPEYTLRHLLLDQVIPRWLGHRGELVLHASAINLPGRGAVLFVGDSGVGKSTLAAALTDGDGARAELLADDCVLVYPGPPASVVASYAGLRLYPDSIAATGRSPDQPVSHYTAKQRVQHRIRHQATPLKAICLLESGGPQQIERSGTAADLMALLRQAFVLDVTDMAHHQSGFVAIRQLVEQDVPVWRVELEHDHARLPSLVASLLDQLASC